MRVLALLGQLHVYAERVSRTDVLDAPTKRRILERAVADANDLRPSVSEFEADFARETIKELEELVAEVTS